MKAIAARKLVILNSKKIKLLYLCPYVGCTYVVYSEDKNKVSAESF